MSRRACDVDVHYIRSDLSGIELALGAAGGKHNLWKDEGAAVMFEFSIHIVLVFYGVLDTSDSFLALLGHLVFANVRGGKGWVNKVQMADGNSIKTLPSGAEVWVHKGSKTL
jgi:hypothetical protein